MDTETISHTPQSREFTELREALYNAQVERFDGSQVEPCHFAQWNPLFIMLGRAEQAAAAGDAAETKRWLSELETSYTALNKDHPRMQVGWMLDQLNAAGGER